VWVLARTHIDWVKHHFFALFLTLGLLFAGTTILTQTLPAFAFIKTTPRGLVGMYSITADHYMLGDFWAVLLSMLVVRFFQTKKHWLLPFISLGMAIVLFSLSRSALAGFVVVLAIYFQHAKEIGQLWKKLFWAFVIVASLYMSTQKSLLFNRPYYIQAVASIFTYPWGVGVANFDLISDDPRFHFLGFSGFSRVTHSILLEFMSGMGVLVVYFWWWCYRIYKVYLEKMVINDYSLALVALIVDFIFNPTYFVTPMLWLFVVLLPLTSEEKSRENHGIVGTGLVVMAIFILLGGLFTMRV
jgi:hypothetical protein